MAGRLTVALVDRLRSAAERHAGDVAVDDGERGSVSFAQFWTRAETLASGLDRLLPPGARLSVALDRGVDAFTVMVACLLAGRSYVPVDRRTPLRRLEAIWRDCRPHALVAPPDLLAALARAGPAAAPSAPPVRIGTGTGASLSLGDVGRSARGAPARRPAGDDEAYVLYTSGSTGGPKGVRITHRNVAAFVAWAVDRFALGPGDRLPVCSPLTFDLAVLDVYGSLASGAAVHPIDEASLMFPRSVSDFVRAHAITVVYAVPALYASLVRARVDPADLASVRAALYAGEEMHVPVLASLRALAPQAQIHNLYGPIETNVITAHQVTADDLHVDHVPIGSAVTGTRTRLWSEGDGKEAAPGDEGEVIVSGPTVCAGYLNDEARTERSRLILDGEVWWRTGDIARRGAGGELTLVGRRDHLVKCNGFRVEPADVEATLVAHPDVQEAAACAVADGRGSNALTAHVVVAPGAVVAPQDLRRWCRDRLPGYMVPAHIHLVDALARTATGKIDRRALVRTAGTARA